MFELVICVLDKDDLARILNPKLISQENPRKTLPTSFKEFLIQWDKP